MSKLGSLWRSHQLPQIDFPSCLFSGGWWPDFVVHFMELVDFHDDIMTWKSFPHYWSFGGGGGGGGGNQRWLVEPPRRPSNVHLCYFCCYLNKLLHIQSSCRWFETPWRSRHWIALFGPMVAFPGNPWNLANDQRGVSLKTRAIIRFGEDEPQTNKKSNRLWNSWPPSKCMNAICMNHNIRVGKQGLWPIHTYKISKIPFSENVVCTLSWMSISFQRCNTYTQMLIHEWWMLYTYLPSPYPAPKAN